LNLNLIYKSNEKNKIKMEKCIKFSLITLFLISSFKYTYTKACTEEKISEADCKANTTCQWTPSTTGTCAGAAACTSITAQSTCTTTKTGCTFTPAVTTPSPADATCKAGSDACVNGFTDQDTCENCQFTPSGGTCSVKTSNPTETKEDFGSCLKFSGLIGLLSLLF
jgi:hypothetical protein